jgi:hypothetical protein
METSKIAQITTDDVSTRRCGRRSAQEQAPRVVVFDRTRVGAILHVCEWKQSNHRERRRRLPATDSRNDLSSLSPIPAVEAVEEGKSEVRRSSGAIGTASRLGSQVNGDQKANSRFVHARTNHIQRKDDTG